MTKNIVKVYHIRKQLRRKQGNQFYKDTSPRNSVTLCGDTVTDRDQRFKGKMVLDWSDKGIDYVICQNCKRIKAAINEKQNTR